MCVEAAGARRSEAAPANLGAVTMWKLALFSRRKYERKVPPNFIWMDGWLFHFFILVTFSLQKAFSISQ